MVKKKHDTSCSGLIAVLAGITATALVVPIFLNIYGIKKADLRQRFHAAITLNTTKLATFSKKATKKEVADTLSKMVIPRKSNKKSTYRQPLC